MELDIMAEFELVIVFSCGFRHIKRLNVQSASSWYAFIQHGNAKLVYLKKHVKIAL